MPMCIRRRLERNRVLDTARVPSTLHIPIKSGSESSSEPDSNSETAASKDDDSAPTIPKRNPGNLGRIRRRWGVQLSSESPSTQYQVGRNRGNTNGVQTAATRHVNHFSDSNLEGCQHPHDDPLVVRTVVANKTVHRVLVDNRSSADIIFASSFDEMGIGREKLEPVNTHLRGFLREKVLPLGSIQLVLTLGEPPCQATTTTRFLIIDASSAYNMLLGRPSLNAIKVVPSVYHMMIKFPTKSGVGMVRGDQRVAREGYSASVKQKAVDNVSMHELDIHEEVLTRPEPSEDLEPVSLDDDPEHLAHIGSRLTEDLKSLLAQFLRQNRDIFAWKQADMGGIGPTVITHRLNTSPSFKPVKQKRRSLAPER